MLNKIFTLTFFFFFYNLNTAYAVHTDYKLIFNNNLRDGFYKHDTNLGVLYIFIGPINEGKLEQQKIIESIDNASYCMHGSSSNKNVICIRMKFTEKNSTVDAFNFVRDKRKVTFLINTDGSQEINPDTYLFSPKIFF